MKLSIITINYNNAEGLRKTMESVFAQTYRDFEYIVVDGASTDVSVDVIKELESEGVRELGAFKWLSEPDTGIYNAMNKGVEIALGKRVVDTFNHSTLCGDKNKSLNRSERSEEKNKGSKSTNNEDGYVLMLNSGDFLVDEHVIERVMPELDGTDIVQGNIIVNHGSMLLRNRGYGKSEITMYDVMGGGFLHQASFCKRALFEKYGYFDESYKIVADTKFFTICLGFNDVSFKYVDIDITDYDCHGISAAKKGPWYQKHIEEYIRLRNEMFAPRLQNYLNENEPKVLWYNKLHQHTWIWNMVRAISRIHFWFYGREKYGLKIENVSGKQQRTCRQDV